jgi:hypothetical protein
MRITDVQDAKDNVPEEVDSGGLPSPLSEILFAGRASGSPIKIAS